MGSNLGVTIIRPENPGPLWPWIVASSRNRGPRKEFEVGDRSGTMAHRGSDAIVTGISTTYDDDIFAFCIDI